MYLLKGGGLLFESYVTKLTVYLRKNKRLVKSLLRLARLKIRAFFFGNHLTLTQEVIIHGLNFTCTEVHVCSYSTKHWKSG